MIRFSQRSLSTLRALVVGLFIACTLLLFSPPSTEAQADPPVQKLAELSGADGVVKVTPQIVGTVTAGGEFQLVAEVKLDRGWHIYGMKLPTDLGMPTQFSVAEPKPFIANGDVTETKPHERYDSMMEATIIEHEKSARFTLPLNVPAGTVAGTYPVKAAFTFMACDASMCLAPETLEITFPVEVVGAAETPGATPVAGASNDGGLESLVVEKKFTPDDPVLVRARGAEEIAAGATFDLVVEAVIDRGWHIYSLYQDPEYGSPAELFPNELGPFEVAAKVSEPKAKPHDRFGAATLEHEGTVPFKLPLRVPEGTKSGRYEVSLSFGYMACDSSMCLDLQTQSFTVPVWVGQKRQVVSGGRGGAAASASEGVPLSISKKAGPAIDLVGRGVDGVEPGQEFEVSIEAKIERGFKIYPTNYTGDEAMPVLVEVTDAGPFEVVEITESEPKTVVAGGKPSEVHVGTAKFTVKLRAPAEVDDGTHSIDVKIRTSACDAEKCLLPETTEFELPVLIGTKAIGTGTNGAGGTATTGVTSIDPDAKITLSATLDRTQLKEGEEVTLSFEGEVRVPDRRIPAIERDLASEQGIWGIILLSISGAFVALLTPCVYPMIPITISVFTKQAHQKRSAVIGLAALFCFGVMASFTTLGLVLSAVLGENGANFMATNPFINFAIGALFVYFAFSLFGYYDVQLPAFLRNKVASTQGGSGVASVLVMGVVFSVTTFTCVGPIAAALLALAAGAGPGYAAIGMLAFSGAFALPFFFLAIFPKALAGLPKSGGWLSTVKGVLGFIELIAAWKFFSATIGGVGLGTIISREVIFAIWGITLVVMALYLIGKVRFPHDSPLKKIGATRVVITALTLIAAGFCFWAVAGKRLNENLESQLLVPSMHAKATHLDWRILSYEYDRTWEGELEEIRASIAAGGEQKPLFINFTGHI